MDAHTEVYQRLSDIENELELARQVSDTAPEAPGALRSCLERLQERSHHARSTYVVTGEEAIAEDLRALEAETQRARTLCEGLGGLVRLVSAGLSRAQEELRDLRRQVRR